jgi:hypothetical protein
MDAEELKKQVQQLKEQADLQAKISGSYSQYLEAVKVYKKTYNEILRNKKIDNELSDKILKNAYSNTAAGKIQKQKDEDRLKILRSQTAEMVAQGKQLRQAIEDTNTLTLSGAKLVATLTKGIGNLPGIVNKGIGKLKDLGLLDMEKSIKMSGLQMGILSKQAVSFRENIKDAAGQTTFIGAGIEDLAKMQSDYSDQIGRAVQLSQESLVSMGRMSKESGLGAEGTAEMVASMDELGLSASKVGDYVNQTMNDAHKMGINSSKVIKNIQSNIKMLNKYHFKDGIKGLAKMAELTTKLGVKMDFASGMSDKLWDIEGAVDMSAQLQVMGGEWAKMADPFHLMYMAREDAAGLTKELAKGAAAAMHFGADGGIELSSQKMSELKIIAQQTNTDYDELVTSGKKLLSLNKIKSQLNFSMSDEAKEYIAATAEFGENGKATIMVGAGKSIKKFVKDLSAEDIASLEARSKEKALAGERAKQAMNFDEALKNTFDKMKIALLPIVEVLNERLIPKFEGFLKRWDKERFGERIENFATKIGEIISALAGWVIDNPIKTAFIYGTTQFGGIFFDTAKWILNGMALSTGFNIGAKKIGGIGGATGPAGGYTKNGMPINRAPGKTGMGAGARIGAGIGLGVAGMGVDYGRSKMDNPESTGGKFLGVGSSALKGAALGMMFGPWGAGIGLGLGAAYGAYDEFIAKEEAQNNGNLTYGKKVGDAKFSVLGGGKITPIDNKDEFYALKPGGAVDKANKSANIPSSINHEFAPIEFKGNITIDTPGNPGKGVELLKDAHFIRQVTGLIHGETKRMMNQKQKS